MLRKVHQAIVAIAAMSLLAVGANAQRPMGRFFYNPYRVAYRAGSVMILDGALPLNFGPSIGFAPYGQPTIYASPLVYGAYYPVGRIGTYGAYRLP